MLLLSLLGEQALGTLAGDVADRGRNTGYDGARCGHDGHVVLVGCACGVPGRACTVCGLSIGLRAGRRRFCHGLTEHRLPH